MNDLKSHVNQYFVDIVSVFKNNIVYDYDDIYEDVKTREADVLHKIKDHWIDLLPEGQSYQDQMYHLISLDLISTRLKALQISTYHRHLQHLLDEVHFEELSYIDRHPLRHDVSNLWHSHPSAAVFIPLIDQQGQSSIQTLWIKEEQPYYLNGSEDQSQRLIKRFQVAQGFHQNLRADLRYIKVDHIGDAHLQTMSEEMHNVSKESVSFLLGLHILYTQRAHEMNYDWGVSSIFTRFAGSGIYLNGCFQNMENNQHDLISQLDMLRRWRRAFSLPSLKVAIYPSLSEVERKSLSNKILSSWSADHLVEVLQSPSTIEDMVTAPHEYMNDPWLIPDTRDVDFVFLNT